MAFAEISRGRRSRLGGLVAIATALVLGVTWLAVQLATANTGIGADEELIRAEVVQSGVVADYSVLKLAHGEPGFTLDISLHHDAPPHATGTLLHTLYEDVDSVARVNLAFAADHTLSTTKLERTPEEWTALVNHVTSAGPVTASFSQMGPTGAATYWLSLKTTAVDPAAEYERVSQLDKPAWLTHGRVEVTTPPDAWPLLAIDAGRDVTADELQTFRALNDELASSIKADEHYELKMHVELGAEAAEFEMRIITEPEKASPQSPAPNATVAPSREDSSGTTAPGEPQDDHASGTSDPGPGAGSDTDSGPSTGAGSGASGSESNAGDASDGGESSVGAPGGNPTENGSGNAESSDSNAKSTNGQDSPGAETGPEHEDSAPKTPSGGGSTPNSSSNSGNPSAALPEKAQKGFGLGVAQKNAPVDLPS